MSWKDNLPKRYRPPKKFLERGHEQQPTEYGWKCNKCKCSVMTIYYDPLTYHRWPDAKEEAQEEEKEKASEQGKGEKDFETR